MGNDLMTEEIEVHPFIARSPFGAAEQFAVKGTRLAKIAHGKSQMKARTFSHEQYPENRQSLVKRC
jgi:hypothetical protein